MATNRNETVLSYKADTRGLKELARELSRTFETTGARDLNRSYRDLNKALKGLTHEQARLNAELLKAKEGTEVYTTLEKALKRVDNQAAQLRRTLTGIRPDPGGFAQGFAQGFAPSVAGYIQRGPGMQAQMAGQALGAGARLPFRIAGRGVSNIGGAFASGSLSTLFAGIPGLGGLAGMAEGAVGSAVAREDAILQALLATGQVAASGGVGRAAMRRSRRGRSARIRRRTAELSAQAEADIRARYSGRRVDPNTGEILPAGEEFRSLVKGIAGTEGAGYPGEFLINPEAVAKRVAAEQKAAKRVEDYLKREADREVKMARKEAAKRAQREERARERRAGRAGSRAALTGGAKAFERLGMDRTQAIQVAGQLSAQIGGGLLSEQAALGIVGAQTQGVAQGTAARLLRQQRAGRGGVGGEVLSKAIGEAVAQGLEGSEVNESLLSLVGLQERAEQQGLKISAEGAGTLSRAFQALGAQGVRGGVLGAQLIGAGQRVGLAGISSPESAALFRAAGFDPAQGGLSYLRASERLENLAAGEGDAGVLFELIRNLSGGVRGRGEFGRLVRGRTLQKSFASLGIQVGSREAQELSTAALQGRGAFEAALSESAAARTLIGGGAPTDAGLRGAAKGVDLKALTGLARQQAAVANQLVVAGERIGPIATRLQKNAARVATGLGGLVQPINDFLPLIERFGKAIENILTETGQELRKNKTATVGG